MEITELGLGTYRLRENAYDSILHSLKVGYNHIDTAPLYKTEESVGNAIFNSGIDRRKLFVTTKISRNELKENKISESIEESLKKLSLDYIDLVLLHEPIDYIKNWELLKNYYLTFGKNKVRYIGVSNFKIEHIESIENIYKPYCNQIEITPFLLRDNLVEYCNKKDIPIVAHSPLAKGEKLDNNQLITLGKIYNKTPAQIMLKWNLQNNNIVIPRSRNKIHLEENLSMNFEIETDDINVINSLDCQYSTHPKYL